MFIFYMCKHNESFLIMQLFARFFRPSGALFGTSAVGDKARRASDRPWTGRAHRSTGRCSAVTGPMGGHPGKAGRQRDHPPARRAGRTARPRGFGQCRHERPPGQPASGLSQVLPVYVRTTGETDDICIRFSPPLLCRAEIMPEAGLRTLRRTAECSGRGRRAGRTRRSPLSF